MIEERKKRWSVLLSEPNEGEQKEGKKEGEGRQGGSEREEIGREIGRERGREIEREGGKEKRVPGRTYRQCQKEYRASTQNVGKVTSGY